MRTFGFGLFDRRTAFPKSGKFGDDYNSIENEHRQKRLVG
jgi:hypothetical protein